MSDKNTNTNKGFFEALKLFMKGKNKDKDQGKTKKAKASKLKFRWVDDPENIGMHLFTFDGKKVYNLFKDYPHNLTEEEIQLFNDSNPYWVQFFEDRNKNQTNNNDNFNNKEMNSLEKNQRNSQPKTDLKQDASIKNIRDFETFENMSDENKIKKVLELLKTEKLMKLRTQSKSREMFTRLLMLNIGAK